MERSGRRGIPGQIAVVAFTDRFAREKGRPPSFIQAGWFPLLLAAGIAFLMLTWRSGVRLVERARARLRQPEEDLIETAVSRCQARDRKSVV